MLFRPCRASPARASGPVGERAGGFVACQVFVPTGEMVTSPVTARFQTAARVRRIGSVIGWAVRQWQSQ